MTAISSAAAMRDALGRAREDLNEGRMEEAAATVRDVVAGLNSLQLSVEEVSSIRAVWAECEELATQRQAEIAGAVRSAADGRKATSRYGSRR